MKDMQIIDTTMDNIREYGVCGYKDPKKPGYAEKLNWLQDRYKQGLKLKILYSQEDKSQGMIEYIPGEYCWRPLQAKGYMVIHCLFVGFRKQYKGKGYASVLIKQCLQEAKKSGRSGVAAVTRKGSFMADKNIFLKNGFQVIEQAAPDFELVVRKFSQNNPSPAFRSNKKELDKKYKKGLYILRADQCPYTVKNVEEISHTAKKDFHLTAQIINLPGSQQAQNNPCPFGTFGIILDGNILAHHPISSKRFLNIMKSIGN